ncbi:MAG: DUF2807 domain-containing protein [Sphingomonadales bacterium]|nr:DUF2807 domain-containing protein [Sphingomonadales bacterium]
MRTSLILTAAGALCLAGCGHAASESAPSSRNAETGQRSFALANFTAVTLAGPHNVTINPGNGFAVVATGPQDVLDDLDLSVGGGTLEIRSERKGKWKFWQGDGDARGRATIVVTMPRVDGLTLAGSGRLSNGAPTGNTFAATLSGSGDLGTGAIAANDVSFSIAGSGALVGGAMNATKTSIDIAGSGTLSAKGRAGTTDIHIAGSGDVDAAGLIAGDADISVMGSGDVAIGATGKVDVAIMGSGDVTVTGTKDCTVSKAGSGNVRCGG